jgi:hypothetical protein
MTPPPPDNLNGSNDAIRCPAYLGSNTARLGYEAHSPWVPGVVALEGLLRPALEGLGPDRLWVNPDCGLKTRRYGQVLPALGRMVTAAAVFEQRWPPARCHPMPALFRPRPRGYLARSR